MKEARGYIYPEWEFAARQDPDSVETYNRLYELGLGEGQLRPLGTARVPRSAAAPTATPTWASRRTHPSIPSRRP